MRHTCLFSNFQKTGKRLDGTNLFGRVGMVEFNIFDDLAKHSGFTVTLVGEADVSTPRPLAKHVPFRFSMANKQKPALAWPTFYFLVSF